MIDVSSGRALGAHLDAVFLGPHTMVSAHNSQRHERV
jgi:hypothetical protein